ncbi:MAG: PDZ domain-containing protein [Elusimicrobia bacterium]|nr:PDZ domain-containing protein [Elusimicrobiota bacterium]
MTTTILAAVCAAFLSAPAFAQDDGKLAVVKVIDNGPAAQAGLLAGDELLAIDGIDLESRKPADASTALPKPGPKKPGAGS